MAQIHQSVSINLKISLDIKQWFGINTAARCTYILFYDCLEKDFGAMERYSIQWRFYFALELRSSHQFKSEQKHPRVSNADAAATSSEAKKNADPKSVFFSSGKYGSH